MVSSSHRPEPRQTLPKQLARRIETRYAVALRKIARHIGELVTGLYPDTGEPSPEAAQSVTEALARYAETIGPWARAAGQRMISEVDAADLKDWVANSERIGRALKSEIQTAPTGRLLQARLAEQVTLIKSLPLEAAQRVHRMTLEGMANGDRASAMVAAIMESGTVSIGRARTIARTEVSRTRSLLTQVRAQHIGATHWSWVTSGDAQVRPSHRAQQGKIYEFGNPPIVDGQPTMPGQTYNCRCRIGILVPDAF